MGPLPLRAPARGWLACPLLTQLRPAEHPSFLQPRCPLAPPTPLPTSCLLGCPSSRTLHTETSPLCSPLTPRWVRSPFPPPPAEHVSGSAFLGLAESQTQSPAPSPAAATLTCPRDDPPGRAWGSKPLQLLTGPDLEIVFGETQASLSSPGGPRSQISVFL